MKHNFLQKRLKSFYYACRGIKYLLRTQPNAWIHSILTLLVVIFGFLFQVNLFEWCILLIAIALVLAAEAFNTALETVVDLVSPEYHELAEIAKDVASGAVLITALFAALVGAIILLPKFWLMIAVFFQH